MSPLRFVPTRHAAVLGTVYAAYGVAAARLPLLHTLGYEFAAVTGLVVGIATGAFAIPLARRAGEMPGRRGVVTLFAALTCSNLLLLAVPFAIMVANASLVPNCAPMDGAAFFLLIPVMTVAFATALAVLLTQVFRGAGAGIAFAVIIAALLVHPVLLIMAQPQLFAYNHLFGLFVGVSWDEARPPLGTLALYRITTAAFTALMVAAAAAVAAARKGGTTAGNRIGVIATGVISCAVLVAGFVESDALRFTTSEAYLRASLGGRCRSAHFTICYDTAAVGRERIAAISREHEFRLAQVERALGVRWTGRITSYLYPDDAAKRRLLGTETSQVARPWAREIHLSMTYWKESLKHELVHVVGSALSDNPLHVPWMRNLGLTEGLAMAVEWDFGNRTLHQHAAAMLADGILPRADRCMTTMGFITGGSSASYVAAGSFTRWLVESRGFPTVARAYREDDVTDAAGMTWRQLDSAWRSYLRTVPRLLPDSLAARYLFTGASIVRKVCPRTVTERNRAASAAMRARRYMDAAVLFAEADRMAPNLRSALGETAALLRSGRKRETLAATTRLLGTPGRRHTLLPLYLFRGDAAAALGDSATADSAYSALVRERPGGWSETGAALHRAILRAPTVVRAIVQPVIERSDTAEDDADNRAQSIAALRRALALDPGNGAIRLMLGSRMAVDPAARREAALLLSGADGGPFAWECQVRASDAWYDAGDAREALAAAGRADAAASTEAQHLAAADRRARCVWTLSGTVGPQW